MPVGSLNLIVETSILDRIKMEHPLKIKDEVVWKPKHTAFLSLIYSLKFSLLSIECVGNWWNLSGTEQNIGPLNKITLSWEMFECNIIFTSW